ncbi:hypothetical protein KM043_012947 [Ampulex compressa]|nr:hypothetical protein KM043_012947 [Ampulex compressa]
MGARRRGLSATELPPTAPTSCRLVTGASLWQSPTDAHGVRIVALQEPILPFLFSHPPSFYSLPPRNRASAGPSGFVPCMHATGPRGPPRRVSQAAILDYRIISRGPRARGFRAEKGAFIPRTDNGSQYVS